MPEVTNGVGAISDEKIINEPSDQSVSGKNDDSGSKPSGVGSSGESSTAVSMGDVSASLKLQKPGVLEASAADEEPSKPTSNTESNTSETSIEKMKDISPSPSNHCDSDEPETTTANMDNPSSSTKDSSGTTADETKPSSPVTGEESTHPETSSVKKIQKSSEPSREIKNDNPEPMTKEVTSGTSKKPGTSGGKDETKEANRNSKSNSVDFVVISDDEGDNSLKCISGMNGNYSPTSDDYEDSDDLDELDVIGDDEDEDSGDNADDEIEITGVSIANNEFGTVGGMDQLLRTLINQGWTETEIMSQLRGMIAPYQSRQKLDNFNSINDVVNCIKRVNKIIIVSGAGISVSCGIPDFRSETGLYARLSKEYPTLPNPTAMFDLNYFLEDPKPFFTFAKEIWPGQFKPSPCHKFIKLIESHGKLLRNYTQNIDTLEQVAGIEKVIQCHGSFATASCIYCRFQVSGDDIKGDIMDGRAPMCPKCKELKLIEGKKVYSEFARAKYREIKKKLRRREKFSSSSSSASSTASDDVAVSSRGSARNRLAPNEAPVESSVSAEQPSSSKQCSSTDAQMEINDAISKDKEQKQSKANMEEDDGQKMKDKEASSDSKHPSPDVKGQQSATTSACRSDKSDEGEADDVGPPLDPILKPDIVFFGEDLPRNFFDHAEEDLEEAELIIVIGSSMKVKPVASIPEFVQERTPRVLINREPVRHISFDVQLLGDADEIVQQLCHQLEWESPVDEGDPDKKRSHRPNIIPLEDLSPLPTRQEIEGSASTSDAEKGNSEKSGEKAVEGDSSKKEKSKDEGNEKQEFEEPCPLFGARCQCPVNWNIAQYLPSDSIVKMQPNTFIFPGANVMHPKHVFTTSNDLYTIDSDSDLGGCENPIEVSSSEGSVQIDDEDHIMESSDDESDVVSTTKSSGEKLDNEDISCHSLKEAVSSKDSDVNKTSRTTSAVDKTVTDTPMLSPRREGEDNTLKRPSDDKPELSNTVPSKIPRLSEDAESKISKKDVAVSQTSDNETHEVPASNDS